MAVQRKTFVRPGRSFDNTEEGYYRQQVEDAINDLVEQIKKISTSNDKQSSTMIKRNLGFFSKTYGVRSL